MGVYINPGNEGFAESVHDEYYADKTGMIRFVNAALGTKRKEICFTRPRRFGKTTAANMLAAYYSCGCDSRNLFRGLQIPQRLSAVHSRRGRGFRAGKGGQRTAGLGGLL